MSRRVKSTYRPKGRGLGRAYPQALIEVEEPQEEPPIEGKDITPGQEREDEGASASPGEGEGASASPGLSLEPAHQEPPEPKTGFEHGDGPDIEGKELPNPEPIKMPEAGEGKPQI